TFLVGYNLKVALRNATNYHPLTVIETHGIVPLAKFSFQDEDSSAHHTCFTCCKNWYDGR
ncbi:hypothetical protein, partial [Nostoc sp. FACHB-87]|uniref:hypothetical protein n=1 Tax=Nostoc sp. FACHB-87 TaxID=2692841 RepID=UPI001A7EE5A0